MAYGVTYIVRTDLDEDDLHEVAMSIYEAWLEFSLGKIELGGKTIKHATGRYAAAIHEPELQSDGSYLIMADDTAIESTILEFGHPQFDLKTKFTKGRAYPIHELGVFKGYFRVGDKKWILPPMPAYAPGRILADLARQEAAGR